MPAAAALVGLYVFVVLVVTYGLQILIWAIGAAVLAGVAAFYVIGTVIYGIMRLVCPGTVRRLLELHDNPNPKPPRPLVFDQPEPRPAAPTTGPHPAGTTAYSAARGTHPGPRRWASLR